jgi:Fe-S oxidoreductase
MAAGRGSHGFDHVERVLAMALRLGAESGADERVLALLQAAGATVAAVPHCCSEAGTLALSRPGITGAMLHRKRTSLAEARAGQAGRAVLLTNCPSCLTGLGRNRDLGIEPRHIAVELARALSCPGWFEMLRERARTAQPVRF